MVKLSLAVTATLAASAAAFAPTQQKSVKSALSASPQEALYKEVGGKVFDPMSLATLGTGEAFDTFPNMFPNKQFLEEAEIKHGRQAMLAWTGVWATTKVCSSSMLVLLFNPSSFDKL
jgi:hypothetical protein